MNKPIECLEDARYKVDAISDAVRILTVFISDVHDHSNEQTRDIQQLQLTLLSAKQMLSICSLIQSTAKHLLTDIDDTIEVSYNHNHI